MSHNLVSFCNTNMLRSSSFKKVVPQISNLFGKSTKTIAYRNHYRYLHSNVESSSNNKWVSKKLTDDDFAEFNERFANETDDYIRNNSQTVTRRTDNIKPKVKPKASTMHVNYDVDENIEMSKVKGFLELNPHICSGCGTPFQSKTPDSPGYLPKDKMQDHRGKAFLIREKQEAMKLLEMAGIEADSAIAEQVLLAGGTKPEVVAGIKEIAIKQKQLLADRSYKSKSSFREEQLAIQAARNALWEDKPPDASQYMTMQEFKELEKRSASVDATESVCICQRCYRLQQYGQVEEVLRPGWSSNELLSPERFQSLLGVIKASEAVVLCLVDVFDLQGSLLANLKDIAGKNPIIIAANKIDLLPRDVSLPRITDWIHTEVKEVCGLQSPQETSDAIYSRSRELTIRRPGHDKDVVVESNPEENVILRRSNIHLVSCTTGFGMQQLMSNLMKQASTRGNKVYVMGAANVGKSSFINRLLDTKYSAIVGKKTLNRNTRRDEVPLATVSNLPGTTLDFLKIKLPNGLTMIDTPGLLNQGQLTAKLNTEELRAVIPRKAINAVTLRVMEGKSVLAGGLAMFELVEGRPFHFTFFMSNDIVLHPTTAEKARDFVDKHIGSKLLSPPYTAERVLALEPFVTHDFEIEGDSWRRSSYDIVVAGLGWMSVTGPGLARVRVTVPEGTSVGIRPALLPFEAPVSTVRFTGGKLMKKNKKGKKGLGYRA